MATPPVFAPVSAIRTILSLLLPGLFSGILFAQAPDRFTGNWESADQHFRLIFYRHQGARQILFYGRDEISAEQNRYVVRAVNIRENAGELLFELPAHPVYSNSQNDAAVAGHRSEIPARENVDAITPWRLTLTEDALRLDCAVAERRLCGLQRPVELHSIM